MITRSLILLLFLTLSFSIKAQVVKAKAQSVSFKTYSTVNGWSEWSEWERVDILVVIDLSEDNITIYSKETQDYDIIKTISTNVLDREGGVTETFRAIDAYGLKCDLRIRFQENNSIQLYIDYVDMLIAYNLRAI